MVTTKTIYVTHDGKEFNTYTEASDHEAKSRSKAEIAYDRYLQTYTGRDLLKLHTLDKYGIWEVKGADTNYDLGGSHVRPKLGRVEGTLKQAILWGCGQSGFFGMGGPEGTFTYIPADEVIKL